MLFGLVAVGCGAIVQDAVNDGGQQGVDAFAKRDGNDSAPLDDASLAVDAYIEFPSWIRVDDTYTDPPFDVCFPLVASLNGPPNFTGAKPAIGGAGIKSGTITPYIAVPPMTNQMRFVTAGSLDCSTKVGVRLDDSIGPFAAQAGKHYTIHVDESGYDYSIITVDAAPKDAGAD